MNLSDILGHSFCQYFGIGKDKAIRNTQKELQEILDAESRLDKGFENGMISKKLYMSEYKKLLDSKKKLDAKS